MGENATKTVDPVFERFCLEIEVAKTLYFRDSLPHYVPVVADATGALKVIRSKANNGDQFIVAFTSVSYLRSCPLLIEVPDYKVMILRTPKEAMVFWTKLVKVMMELNAIPKREDGKCVHSVGIAFNFTDHVLRTELTTACLVCYLAFLVDLVKNTPEPPPLFPPVEEEVEEVAEVETFPLDNPEKESLET